MAWWIFQNIVITSVLVAIAALVCRTGRLGPVARHALWVLVLVKFVTPPLVVWPWAAPDPLGISTIDSIRAADANSTDTIPLRLEPTSPDRAAASLSAAALLSPTDAEGHAGTTVLLNGLDLSAALPWLLAIWATGSVGLLTIESLRLVRLSRRMRNTIVPETALADRVAALARQLGIPPVPIVMMAGATSPVVWGAGRPQLLWPAALPVDDNHACVDGLIVHELAHVKRRDHLVGWLELAAGIVWWWNPLFWYARGAMREQAELACDAWVISTLPNGRRAYAESLLTLSGATFRGASPPMAVVGVRATNRRMLERRLVMIMKGRTPLRLPFIGLCSLALVAAATLPTWAASQNPPTPPVPPPPPTPIIREIAPPPAPAPPQVPPAVPATPSPRSRIAVREVPPPTQTSRRLQEPRPVVITTGGRNTLVLAESLPDDVKTLIDEFSADQEAIRIEAEQRVKARREATVTSLENLQERYTREGKLDEAIAIRNYLRAGGPGTGIVRSVRRVR